MYIIMELCSNNTMLELVKRKKRLTEAETRKFMVQIIEGANTAAIDGTRTLVIGMSRLFI